MYLEEQLIRNIEIKTKSAKELILKQELIEH